MHGVTAGQPCQAKEVLFHIKMGYYFNFLIPKGEIYKEVDAICLRDKCYCVFAKGYCK